MPRQSDSGRYSGEVHSASRVGARRATCSVIKYLVKVIASPHSLNAYLSVPFRLSRNYFMIERRDGSYCVRDLRSTLGTIVNGQPIGEHFRHDDAPLRVGENEVCGVDSPFVFPVFLRSQFDRRLGSASHSARLETNTIRSISRLRRRSVSTCRRAFAGCEVG
jgi:hypothetical protein